MREIRLNDKVYFREGSYNLKGCVIQVLGTGRQIQYEVRWCDESISIVKASIALCRDEVDNLSVNSVALLCSMYLSIIYI